jgi:5-methylcytosine-specific restriction endonuclease McrA
LKKSYIKPISKKQSVELARRRELKADLIRERGAICMTCGQRPSFPPISLSHIIPLSRGGKTDRNNCILEDESCHSKYEKKPETRPVDSIGYKLWVAQKEL